MGAQEDQERGQPIDSPRNPLAAEDEDAEKDRFKEKRKDSLGGQGRPEDVADRSGVAGPIVAESELEDDAGGHAHDEDDAEDAHEVGG